MTGVFIGSFDPFTVGHYDIARRAAALVDNLVIGVGVNTNKRTLFLVEQRLEMVTQAVKDIKNAKVVAFDNLAAEFADSVKASILFRGLRTVADFEYEKALCEVYKAQNRRLECVYLIASAKYSHISGNVVRELIQMKAPLEGYVPSEIIHYLQK